jgi:hypothetical protein
MIYVFKLTEVEDELVLIQKLKDIFQLVRASSTIFRPYEQNFVTPG